tara:strand:- start:44 stop:457 length:414 start_codon:yes stop_codon:yes gene_type:complete
MIEVKFSGGSMRALREQMAHFLDALYVPPPGVLHDHRAVLHDPEPAPKAKPQPKPVAEVVAPVALEPTVAEVVAPEAAASEITYAEVKHAVLSVSVKHGREGVFALLNRFGAKKNASEIDPTRWVEVLEAVKSLAGD